MVVHCLYFSSPSYMLKITTIKTKTYVSQTALAWVHTWQKLIWSCSHHLAHAGASENGILLGETWVGGVCWDMRHFWKTEVLPGIEKCVEVIENFGWL